MNSKKRTFSLLPTFFFLTLLLAMPSAAQAPAGAPAGSTGICKDGTYSTAASKDGACRGHKGVQTWYSASTKPAATPSAPAPARTPAPAPAPQPAPAAAPSSPAPARTPVPAPAPQPSPAAPAKAVPPAKPGIAAERTRLAAMQPAPGGGPGLVWLNGSSNVYHCPGSDFYGKTKTGSYLSEADAKAKGAHADHNKPCS